MNYYISHHIQNEVNNAIIVHVSILLIIDCYISTVLVLLSAITSNYSCSYYRITATVGDACYRKHTRTCMWVSDRRYPEARVHSDNNNHTDGSNDTSSGGELNAEICCLQSCYLPGRITRAAAGQDYEGYSKGAAKTTPCCANKKSGGSLWHRRRHPCRRP